MLRDHRCRKEKSIAEGLRYIANKTNTTRYYSDSDAERTTAETRMHQVANDEESEERGLIYNLILSVTVSSSPPCHLNFPFFFQIMYPK